MAVSGGLLRVSQGDAFGQAKTFDIFSAAFGSILFIMAFNCLLGPHSRNCVQPSLTACFMHLSQRTGLTSCSPSNLMISCGGVFGPIACPVVFMYTVQLGDEGLSLARSSS